MNENLPPENPVPADPPRAATPPKRAKSRWRRPPILPFLLFVLIVGTLGAAFGPGPLGEDKTVVIPHGTGPRDAADLLEKNDVIYNAFLFRVMAKFAAGNVLKAGEYKITAGESMADIVGMIHEGRSVVRLFTVAEGLTSKEAMQLLANDPVLNGSAALPPEGSLLPETYRYMYGDSRAGLTGRMQKSMQEALAELWPKRDTNLPINTPEEAVIMASVIEKETGKAAERPRIAGVFYNRLKLHMRLQSDPTVIYGIVKAKGGMDHAIDHDDLAFVSPYNTYLNDGLPPGPICNPGRAALAAALHPEGNDYLYFVADGTGGHVFARSLAEHNQNVTKWNQAKAAIQK